MEVNVEDLAERLNMICRFCLSDDNCLPIFLSDNNFNERLHRGFEIIVSKVDENDGLPNNICSGCLRCIEEFASFETTCIKSYETLERTIRLLERANENEKKCFDVLEKNTDFNTFIDTDETATQPQKPINMVESYTDPLTVCKSHSPEQMVDIDKQNTNCKHDQGAEQLDIEEEYIIDYEEVGDPMELDEPEELENQGLVKLEVEITPNEKGGSGGESCEFAESVEHLSEDQKQMFLEATEVKAKGWVCRNGRKIPIVECTFCNKTYRGRNTLRKHLKLHFKIRNYVCRYCSRSFSDRSSLRLHEFRHSSVKAFNCEHCERSYYSRPELRQHCILQHDKRKFVCTVCNAKFPIKAILDDHSRVHISDRPFVCNICGHSFKRNRNLARHLTCHKERTQEGKVNGSTLQKSISCQYCSFRFEVPSELLEHIIDQHPQEYTQTRKETHSCPYCYTTFNELDKCLMHQNKHFVFPVITAGGRIYECGECGRQLRYKSLAQKHLLSHGTKTMFECPYEGCLKKYKHKVHYSRHIRAAHESTGQSLQGDTNSE